MRAAVVESYGPPEVVQIVDRDMPEPKPDEVLVRVEAVAVTAGDQRIRSGIFPHGFATLGKIALGLRRPRKPVLGVAYAGTVERVGEGVSGFAPGDEVAGVNGKTMGMHAQFATVPASRAARKPDGLSHADAAGLLFGGTTALYFLRDRAKVRPGDTVLVNGASGAVGSAAVQVARILGANVTAVTSARNADLLRRLGADRVVDYAQTPVDSMNERYDVVVDAVGNIDRRTGRRLLRPEGRLVLIVADLATTISARGKVIAGVAPERPEDCAELMRLAATGQLDPLATVVGGLEALVDAYRVADSGRKVGNLVVTPQTE